MKLIYFLTHSFLFPMGEVFAQSNSGGTDHSLSLNISFTQVKDQFNYGMSFGGLNLTGTYEMRSTAGKMDLSYGAAFGVGGVHN